MKKRYIEEECPRQSFPVVAGENDVEVDDEQEHDDCGQDEERHLYQAGYAIVPEYFN